jgi:hypothetical protein
MADAVGTAYVNVEGDFSGFQAALADAGSDMASTLGGAGEEAGSAASAGMSDGMQTFGATMAGVLGANVVTKATDSLTGFFSGAVDKAKGAEMANLRFETSLRNVAGASDEQIKSTSAFLKTLGSTTATSGTQLKDAYSQILRGTKDVGEAQRATALATDISAATGKDMSGVAMALSRAYMGNTTALSRMGVETKNADGSAKSLDQMMGDLEKTFGGTAEKAAGTAAGSMKKAELAFGGVQKEVGTALLPTIISLADSFTTYLLPVIKIVAQIFGTFMDVLGPVVPLIAVLVVGIKAWSIAQTILNTVMAANPILLVVVAIAALVASIIWAYKNVQWFHDAVDALGDVFQLVFGSILAVVQGVWNWVKDNWPLLLAVLTGPIGMAVLIITTYWDQIKAVVMGVFNWITDHWQLLLAIFLGPFVGLVAYVVSNWDSITAKARAVVDAIVGFFGGLGEKLVAPFRTAVDWVRNFFGGLADKVGEVVTSAKGKIGELVTAIAELPKKIVDAFGNAGKLLYDVGRQIIQGLIDGIKNMAGAAAGAVKDVAGSLVGGAKSMLHIGSPSKVFYGIGQDIDRGLANGIGDSSLSLNAIADTSAGLAGAGSVSAAPAGAAITSNFTVNGSVYGVDDLDSYMDQRDRKLALTLAGGRR